MSTLAVGKAVKGYETEVLNRAGAARGDGRLWCLHRGWRLEVVE
jgi:hypothetical protein